MNWTESFQIVGAALASVTFGGGLVLALSSWLGKVWASRILENEQHNLEILKESTLRFRNDKLNAYREIVSTVAKMLALMDAKADGRLSADDANASFDHFNEQRIRLYAYLAMLAPQEVMDAQDELMDYILEICAERTQYDWAEVRTKALRSLNAMRNDIGIAKHSIRYNGRL